MINIEKIIIHEISNGNWDGLWNGVTGPESCSCSEFSGPCDKLQYCKLFGYEFGEMVTMPFEEFLIQTLEYEECDGLYNINGECACKLNDIVTCGESCLDCIPGVEMPCDGTCPDGNCDFHIGNKK